MRSFSGAAGPLSESLSIRPEHVHLPARQSDTNRPPVTVERVDFFGTELVVTRRFDRAARLIRLPMRDDGPVRKAGDRVELGVATERCMIVPDDT
jgi:hypothetical protein